MKRVLINFIGMILFTSLMVIFIGIIAGMMYTWQNDEIGQYVADKLVETGYYSYTEKTMPDD